MDGLEPWLAVTIEGELSEALRHWEEGTNRCQSTGKSRGLSYDDGSNLRIPSARKGPWAQITKFLTFKDPIQITLSDSVIRVNASIAHQASQRYAKDNRKNLTEGTVGGLIKLQEFEIVATDLGPRDKRLTLYVKDFKSLGSEGSGTFGVAPQAIEGRERTKTLLKKLAALRGHGSDARCEQSAASSPLKSQPSTQTLEAENDQDSQVGFATQVPRSIASVVSKSKSLGLATSITTGSTSSSNIAKSLASPKMVKHGNPLASSVSPLQVRAAPQRPSVSQKEALLGLIQSHERATLAPELIPEPDSEQSSGKLTASIEPAARAREDKAFQDISLAPSGFTTRRAPVKVQKRKRQSLENTPRKKASNDLDSQGIDNSRESLAINNDLDNRPNSGVAATKASSDTLHSQNTHPAVSKSANFSPNALLEPSNHSIPENTSSASARNTGRNRISNRDVNISKEQEILLSRADSWLPAEPGQREPSANLPISLLERLNQNASLRAQELTMLRKQGNCSPTPNAETDQTAPSESDDPVSSGQWPASPEREQLPPDSSSASAEPSDDSVHRVLNNPPLVSSARKQFDASISSYSMLSGPPSPIQARQLSKYSGPPGMTPSNALSPSGTSTSAGEEIHYFKCQASNCNKSYKKYGGLKDHVNRYHTSTGSLESFKCPARYCAKTYAHLDGLEDYVEHDHDANSVPPSHSGSPTPTTPGVSTPLFPSSKSQKKRDGGSRRELPDAEADNQSDSLKTSASVPLLLGEKSKSPRNEETFRPCSSTNSEPGGVMSPNAPPAPIQPTITIARRTYAAEENLSSPLPASPTPESDLEFTIPLALNEKTDSSASNAPMQRFPSTASQPQEPFTQVKRTPYVDGCVQNEVLPGSRILSSLLNSNSYHLANGDKNDHTDFVSAPYTPGLEASAAETHREKGSFHAIEAQRIGKVVARLTEESNSQEVADTNAERPNDLIAEDQQQIAADKADSSSIVIAESQYQSGGLNQPATVAEANIQNQVVSAKPSTPEGDRRKFQPQLSTPDHTAQITNEMKRKIADSSFVSPSVAIRQKRFKASSAFTFTERSDVPRDPSEGARQYRQDFLASRRSSENSTPAMSPTMPFTLFPGATPENPRDPSERARQTRQEFLASRRSSETSTPTTSPRIQFTAPTGTIPVECRNAEVENNVEEVNLQNQSFDTKIERQKMTELQEVSARSQTQELRLSAAPLPNGTAPVEADGEDANTGAQDNPPSNYEADSPMFFPQNADIEGPDAEQSIIIKASSYISNDEIQRAQYIELYVPVRSPGHRGAEDALANAKDETDQTIDLGIDMNVASHGLANRDEENQPVEPESEKARKNPPTRADEVVEHEGNVSTPRVVLDHVAEPEKAPLKSIRQQYLIEESLDTQMPDQTMSEPTYQQQPFAIDPKTPMPDQITTEPISGRHPIEADTITTMADVEVFQDIRSFKPISRLGDIMNQIIPLSGVVPASVAGSSNTEERLHLSPTTLGPTMPLSTPMPDSKVKPAEGHRNPVQLRINITKQNPLSGYQNIFDKFKATYPAYLGDMKHFAAICRKISQLVKGNRMVHQSLWDDFVVRHKIEYSQYLRRCAEEAEDAVPYEIFYQNEIDGPQYEKRVINRRNIDEALALVEQQPGFEQVHAVPVRGDEPRVKPMGYKSTFNLDPFIERLHHEYAPAKTHESSEVVGTISTSTQKPVLSCEIERRPSESRVVIDLTEDDPPGSDHSVLQSSSKATASISSKVLPGSGLREIRAKGSNSADNARFRVSANSIAKGPKQSQGLLNTCHRVIQSNWGIRAHELLEPEYYDGQAWSETMIELLSEIASKVNIDEARNRIKEAVDTRIRCNARREAGHACQDRKILKSDLEVVRGIVVTSSMSTSSPFSPPHTNAAVEKQNEGTPVEWWEDGNSPFKSFARAYTSIQHGKGNSFAKVGPADPEATPRVHESASSGLQLKKIDIMRWNI